jgi:hypothetical protein
VGRQLVAETQLLCVQVSDEPESLSELSGASSTGATPFLGDVLSEEVKCNRPVATQQAGSRSFFWQRHMRNCTIQERYQLGSKLYKQSLAEE